MVPSIEIKPPETISAQVELSVTVTNKNFSKELQDRSSAVFKEFNETFTKEMDRVYAKIPAYAGVNITGLSSGSVVVQHDVILQTKLDTEYKEEFKKFTEEIKEKITNVTQQQIIENGSCNAELCFNTTATELKNISIKEYDPHKDCKERVGKDLAQYFFVAYKDKQPKCINRCMPGFDASLNCNFGTCKLERSGPKCHCLNTDTAWYSGGNL